MITAVNLKCDQQNLCEIETKISRKVTTASATPTATTKPKTTRKQQPESNRNKENLPKFVVTSIVIPVVGIKPERWYVSGRHSMAGPVKEFTAIDIDPKKPIRCILSDRASEKLLADARSESNEFLVDKALLLLPSSEISPLLSSFTMSSVVSLFIAVMLEF